MKRPRPQSLPSVTFERQTHCGKIYVTVTTDPKGLPLEVFVRFGKAGHCGAAIFDAMTKILSYALRSGMDPQEAVKALAGIGCSYGKRTCMNAVAEALRDVLDQGSNEEVVTKQIELPESGASGGASPRSSAASRSFHSTAGFEKVLAIEATTGGRN